MPSIAVLGTEEAGKTVLVSCLVKYVQQFGEGISLDPQSAEAQLYVDRVWRQLQNHDWPPKTQEGQIPILEWTLHLPGLAASPFRLIDPRGHDLRRIFSADANLASIPPELQELASTVATSDIVILLVNLGDFLGTPEGDRRRGSELVVKFILDACLRRQPAPSIALVFTQADRFPDVLTSQNMDLHPVTKRYLPLVYESMTRHPHFASGGIYGCVVSAVNKTRIVVDTNNVARSVPAPGFQSDGFDGLLQWLQIVAAKPPAWDWEKFKPWANALWISLLVLFFLRGCWNRPKVPAKPNAPGAFLSKSPLPKIVFSQARYSMKSLIDWDVEVTGQVRNDGGSGSVTIFAGLLCGDKEWEKETVTYLAAGATSDFQIDFKEYSMGNAKFAVSTARDAVQKLSAYHSVPK